MILFFDTETTGKANFKSSPTSKSQPRMVQLAAILADETGTERACLNCIIHPNGFSIPSEASDIHGITTEIATDCGVPLRDALWLFLKLAVKSSLYVAHNLDFDHFILSGETERCLMRLPDRDEFCTMKAMTPVCKLPGSYDDFKWPKLQEAYKHAFGAEFDGAHDALADVRACMKVYFWLKNNKPIPAAADKQQ